MYEPVRKILLNGERIVPEDNPNPTETAKLEKTVSLEKLSVSLPKPSPGKYEDFLAEEFMMAELEEEREPMPAFVDPNAGWSVLPKSTLYPIDQMAKEVLKENRDFSNDFQMHDLSELTEEERSNLT